MVLHSSVLERISRPQGLTVRTLADGKQSVDSNVAPLLPHIWDEMAGGDAQVRPFNSSGSLVRDHPLILTSLSGTWSILFKLAIPAIFGPFNLFWNIFFVVYQSTTLFFPYTKHAISIVLISSTQFWSEKQPVFSTWFCLGLLMIYSLNIKIQSLIFSLMEVIRMVWPNVWQGWKSLG